MTTFQNIENFRVRPRRLFLEKFGEWGCQGMECQGSESGNSQKSLSGGDGRSEERRVGKECA